MGGDDIGGVDDGVAHHPRLVDLVGCDPGCRQPECRFVSGRAVEAALRFAGVDRQLGIELQLEAGDFGALQLYDVLARL